MSQRLQSKRLISAITVLAISFSLSGCVYLRLLHFKNQLKSFDENVSVNTADKLTFAFRNPVVRDSDFVFISGANPDKIERPPQSSDVEVWTWTFEKRLGYPEDKPYRMEFKTRFEEGLLTQMEIDESFAKLVGNELILSLFRKLANAKINKLRRSMSAELNERSLREMSLPSLSEIIDEMGEPTRILKPQSLKNARFEYEFNFLDPKSGKNAGQFRLYFAGHLENPEFEITSFRITGKAR